MPWLLPATISVWSINLVFMNYVLGSYMLYESISYLCRNFLGIVYENFKWDGFFCRKGCKEHWNKVKANWSHVTSCLPFYKVTLELFKKKNKFLFGWRFLSCLLSQSSSFMLTRQSSCVTSRVLTNNIVPMYQNPAKNMLYREPLRTHFWHMYTHTQLYIPTTNKQIHTHVYTIYCLLFASSKYR